jgi:hypothetical protein
MGTGRAMISIPTVLGQQSFEFSTEVYTMSGQTRNLGVGVLSLAATLNSDLV